MNRLSQLGLRIPTKSKFCSSNLTKVFFDYQKETCIMLLNNPKAFNALDLEMLEIIDQELKSWEKNNDYPKNLIIKSDHPKAFCAGGDIVTLLHMYNNNAPEKEMLQFFKTEFEVDYKLANLGSKGVNTFALWDGIIMGGGVGLSSGCQYKVASEKTLYAMPETRIGLFVDVAISFYLTKLENNLGRYLAVVGQRLKGGDVFLSGLANAFVPHSEMGELEEMIINSGEKEVQEFMEQRGNYEVSNIGEMIDWVAFNCVVKEVFLKMGEDVRKVISAHEDVLSRLEDNKLDFSQLLDGFSHIIPGKFSKSKV